MKVEFFKLIETGACGVFRCPVRLPEPALELADQAGWRTVPVDLLGARDKHKFLTALAGALRFPDYFGHNWDALYDCLLDIEHAGRGTLIVLQSASNFARAEPDEFSAAMGALADATDYWTNDDRSLLVVVELETGALAPDLAEITLPAA